MIGCLMIILNNWLQARHGNKAPLDEAPNSKMIPHPDKEG